MMSVQDASASVILLWKTWSIHGFVLFSLSLQVVLFFAAPFRKKTTNVALVVVIWSAYQLVGTAISRGLALILIANKEQAHRAEQVDLYTFWSAFLILHFGGPDTITALAMEDNNLWRRSWLQFVAHVIAILNAVSALPLNTLLLWPKVYISTLVILLAGLIKSAQRILSLTNASYNRLQWTLVPNNPKAGPDYAAIVEGYELYEKVGIPVVFHRPAEPPPPQIESSTTSTANRELTEVQVANQAYRFFSKFKGMYVDMVFCCHDRKESRDFFLGLSSQDVFRVLETEMKLAYEAFYTKIPSYYLPHLGGLRCFSFILELIAVLLWSLEHKHRFRPVDVKVTNILLAGAVFIDVVSLVRHYCSDWKIGAQNAGMSSPRLCCRTPCVMRMPQCYRSQRILFRQWSESISQFNLIDYCIYQRPQWRNKLYSLTGSKDLMDGWRYVSETWLTNPLRDFIFGQLKSKAVEAEELHIGEEVSSSRGSWILGCNPNNDLDAATFNPWIMDVEYDESLVIWHIATELCYQTEKEPDDDAEQWNRRFSKILSDYMFYLLVRQPKLMSEMAPMAEVIFNDTFQGAQQFLGAEMATSIPNYSKCEAKRKGIHKEACQVIMEVRAELPPSHFRGESKSVLFDGCQLAKKLNKKVDQWNFTGQIWVELLCYAAAQSPASVHAMQLCAGGELLTLVRLLMLHLGLSNQFRKAKKSIPRAELLIGM